MWDEVTVGIFFWQWYRGPIGGEDIKSSTTPLILRQQVRLRYAVWV